MECNQVNIRVEIDLRRQVRVIGEAEARKLVNKDYVTDYPCEI